MGIKYSVQRNRRVSSYRARDPRTQAVADIEIEHGWEFPLAEPKFNEDQQGYFFGNIPPHFSYLQSDPRVTGPAMRLAMRALMDHPGATPSNSLSVHSAPLVRKAVGLGLVKPPSHNESIEPNNSIGKEIRLLGYDLDEEIPRHRMEEARLATKNAFRGKKPLNEVQFGGQIPGQMSIFGHESD